MKYTFLLALLFLIQGTSAQRIVLQNQNQLDALEKRVAFLTRDCLETHLRLDSLIGEMKNPPWNNIHLNLSDSAGILITPFGAFNTSVSVLDSDQWASWPTSGDGGDAINLGVPLGLSAPYIVNSDNSILSIWVDSIIEKPKWGEQTKLTISNETPSNKWRHVDHALYQVRGYILYGDDGEPKYFDRNKKPFPSYIKIWP